MVEVVVVVGKLIAAINPPCNGGQRTICLVPAPTLPWSTAETLLLKSLPGCGCCRRVVELGGGRRRTEIAIRALPTARC